MTRRVAVSALFAVLGCQTSPGNAGDTGGFGTGTSGDGTETDGPGTSSGSGGDTDTSGTSTTGSGGGSTGGPIFDVGAGTSTTGPVDMCKVVDNMDAVGDCMSEAPPDSFQEDIQWSWMGDGIYQQIITTPLVANITDDNQDGEIDLCDTPDIIVPVVGQDTIWFSGGFLFALDGATGTQHWQSELPIWSSVTPAVGDVDGDGVSEIVTIASANGAGLSQAHAPKPLYIFDHEGKLQTTGDDIVVEACDTGCAVALADLDNDEDVEILVGHLIMDHEGKIVQSLADANPSYSSWTNTVPTAADLDGDGDLEVVLGRSAYHHDGTEVYHRGELKMGTPQIADLDDDGDPEILLYNPDGISILEHDGTPKVTNLRPTGETPGNQDWMRPATIHDMNGDGAPEFAASTGDNYVVYDADVQVLWSAPIEDYTGAAGSTAFDFLGDGTAEAMYADHTNLFIFDWGGTALLTAPRSSKTYKEYPVVADVDNDGSAEVVVVSHQNFDGQQTAPSVQVVRDAEDRWIQARRIWNQHTYHVTNVREDGTIPQFEPAHWKTTNTFRTQAQIEDGGVCVPEG